jgi:hypothetical protein
MEMLARILPCWIERTHPHESHKRQAKRSPQYHGKVGMLLRLKSLLVRCRVARRYAVQALDGYRQYSITEHPYRHETCSERSVFVLQGKKINEAR